MKDYQLRVVHERADLVAKRDGLERFIESTTFSDLPEREKLTLELQLKVMSQYVDILSTRISYF